MPHRIALTRLCAAALATAGVCAPAAAQDAGTYAWAGHLAAGGELRVFVSRGDVTVTRARGPDARIHARSGGERDGDDAVRYELLERNGVVVVCAIARSAGASAHCTEGGIEGAERRRGPDAWAHVTVELPSGVHLRTVSGGGTLDVTDAAGRIHARTGAGPVRIDGGAEVDVSTGSGAVTVANAAGPVSARTGSGEVTVTTAAGPVRASTGSGAIDVRIHAWHSDGDVVLRTGAGPVALHLPSGWAGDVDARTGNGGFQTAFPVLVVGTLAPGHLRGTIGGGGPTLQVRTGGGSVSLHRAGGS